MPRRGQPICTEGLPSHELESPSGERSSWIGDIRHHGEQSFCMPLQTSSYMNSGPSPRDWLYRVPQVIRFPWQQGLLCKTGSRDACLDVF